MERLKHIKEAIMCCVEGEVGNLAQANTEELGDAIDMLKDLEEAIYYATITKAMNSKEGQGEHGSREHEVMYYPYPMYYPEDYYDPYRDMDRNKGKMYYGGGNSNGSGSQGGSSGGNNMGGSSTRNYSEMSTPGYMRDAREGRSPRSRRTYMEAKEMHHGKETQMKELETYMQELTDDIAEMIKDSSPEEKQLMQKKIATLAEKVGKINV